MVTPPLLSHQFKAEPCRCFRRVAPIIGRINLGLTRNLILSIINLTAAFRHSFAVSLTVIAHGHSVTKIFRVGYTSRKLIAIL